MSMDPVLLDACGDVLAAQFAGVTKVLTGAFWDGSRKVGLTEVKKNGCNSRNWVYPQKLTVRT